MYLFTEKKTLNPILNRINYDIPKVLYCVVYAVPVTATIHIM